MQTNAIDLAGLFSAPELAARHPRILSEATLRYQLRSRETNGLGKACVRIGKKLLISECGYRAWLGTQQAQDQS
jgi:hypothetical protein